MVSKKGRGRWRKGSPDGGLAVLAPLLPPRLAAALRSPGTCLVVLTLAAVTDAVLATTLWVNIHRLMGTGVSVSIFWRALLDDKHDTADLVLLSLLRPLCVALLASAAWYAAARKAPGRRARESAAPASARAHAHASDTSEDVLTQPLLTPEGDEEAPASQPAAQTEAQLPPVRAAHEQPSDAHKRAKKAAKAAKAARAAAAASAGTALIGDVTSRRWVYGLKAASWALVSGSQLYVGVRAVTLPSSSASQDVHLAVALFATVVLGYMQHGAAFTAVDGASSRLWAAAAPAAHADDSAAESQLVLRTDAGPVTRPVLSQGAYLRWAFSLVSTHAASVTIGILCLLASNACDLALPRVGGAALDAALTGDSPAFTSALRTSAGLQVASGALGGIRGACLASAAAHVACALSVRLYAALLRQDVAFYDAASTGDLLSRLTDDVKAATDPASWILSALGRALIQAIGAAAACVHISWRLTLLAGAATGPVFALTTMYAHYSAGLQRCRSDALGAASGAAGDALGNARGVRAAGCEAAELSAYSRLAVVARQLGVSDARAYALTVALNEWVTNGASLLVLAAGGHLVMKGGLSVGALVAFQAYFSRVDASWQSALSFIASLSTSAGAAERVLAVLQLKPCIGAPLPDSAGDEDSIVTAAAAAAAAAEDDALDMPPQWASSLSGGGGGGLSLAIDSITFAYQQRLQAPVLRGFSLNVPAGGTAALVGRSGCGKSTVIHLCMRFYDPHAGTISLGGVPLRDVPYAALRASVALVAQDAPVFAGSIAHNISYGASTRLARDSDALTAAASAAAAHEFITSFPDGYATLVGDRGVRLSAGQRQRVALARALLRQPRLLLADEATASLDAESEAAVQAALDAAAASGKHTLMLVAHRLSTVRNCNCIAVLNAGVVAEAGTHDELIARQQGVYSRLVARQLAAATGAVSATVGRDWRRDAAAAACVGGEIQALLA